MNNRPYNKYNRDYIVGICNGDGCLLTTAIYLSMPSSVKPTCFIAQEASKPLSAPAVPLSLSVFLAFCDIFRVSTCCTCSNMSLFFEKYHKHS